MSLPQSAIFSPSVARAAASAAKDWNYIDAWLHAKFHATGRSPPSFERNADTLRALLALANANEAADESRILLSRLESQALSELKSADTRASPSSAESSQDPDPASGAREAILAAIQSNLSREGTTALETMATLAVETGTAFPTPSTLGDRLLSLSSQLHELETTSARIDVLSRYISSEAAKTSNLVHELQSSEEYRPSPSLAKENLESQRRIKILTTLVPQFRDKLANLSSAIGTPSPTIPQVRAEEEAYLALLAEKNELDAQVRSFQGLPPDTDAARQELEHMRSELRSITQRRDAVFEGLVERETPKKLTR